MSNSMLWVTFVPIAWQTEQCWGLTSTQVNAFSVSYLISYIPGTIVALIVLTFLRSRCRHNSNNDDGLMYGLVVAAMGTTVGAWIRYVAAASSSSLVKSSGGTIYSLVLVGQYVAATCQPFFTTIPPTLATVWFPRSERNVATAVSSMANPIGVAIGSVLPTVFVSERTTTNNNDDDDGNIVLLPQRGIRTLLYVEAIISTVACTCFTAVLVFLLGLSSRSGVPVPPVSTSSTMAAAADVPAIEEERPMMGSFNDRNDNNYDDTTVDDRTDEFILYGMMKYNVMLCLKSHDFVVLLIAFGIGLGVFNAITALMEELLTTFCYTSNDASLFAALLLGCGLLSSGIVGIYLDKTKSYRRILKLLFSLATTTLLLYSVVLMMTPHAKPAVAELAIVFSILGSTMLPILPTTLEAAVECTYPVPEEVSSGLLMSAGMLTGIGFIYGLQKLTDAQPSCEERRNRNDDDGSSFFYNVSWPSVVLVVSGLIATVTAYNFRGPLLRLQAEQQGRPAAAVTNDENDSEVEREDGHGANEPFLIGPAEN